VSRIARSDETPQKRVDRTHGPAIIMMTTYYQYLQFIQGIHLKSAVY